MFYARCQRWNAHLNPFTIPWKNAVVNNVSFPQKMLSQVHLISVVMLHNACKALEIPHKVPKVKVFLPPSLVLNSYYRPVFELQGSHQQRPELSQMQHHLKYGWGLKKYITFRVYEALITQKEPLTLANPH